MLRKACALVLLNLLNYASLAFYLFFITSLINPIKHEHPCKILYVKRPITTKALEWSNNNKFEPVNEISNNLVCATSKASEQPAHARSLIRAFASRLSIL